MIWRTFRDAVRRRNVLIAFGSALCAFSASADTLDISNQPLVFYSQRVPSETVVTAKVATVTGGQYTLTTEGKNTILDVTGGEWKTWNPSGTSSELYLGAVKEAQIATLDGPFTLRLSGSGTQFTTKTVWAQYGSYRFELLDGATWVNTNGFSILKYYYPYTGKGNATVVMNDATFRSVGGELSFGSANTRCEYCNMYVTNSLFYANGSSTMGYSHAGFNRGTFIFSGSTVQLLEPSDYACSIGDAKMFLCDGTDFTGRIRLGGKSDLTIDDATVSVERFNLGTSTTTSTGAVHLVSGTLTCGVYLRACDQPQPAWLDLRGGTLRAYTLVGWNNTRAKQPTKTGFARFTSRGGTIQCTGAASITAWDLAEIGAGGLTLDTSSYTCTVNQDIADVAGEDGLLVKTGAGTLTLTVPSAYSVSATRIEEGTFAVGAAAADAAVTLATDLTLLSETVFSTVGNAKDLTLDSLDANGVTLKLDPDDTVTVTGAAAFKNLTLQFSTVPDLDVAKDIVTVQGAISSESVAAFTSAIVDNVFPSGTYGKLTSRTSGGATIFTITTKTAPVVSGETKWRGPGSAWKDSANWSASVPTGSTKATFDDSTAPASVTVASASDVGALSFEAGGFTLTGAGSLALAAPGASYVTASAGSHTVNVPVAQEASTPYTVAADAALTLAKSVTGGAFVKSGTGSLTLSGANAFAGSCELSAGILSLGSAGALGGVTTLSLGDATLATTAAATLPSTTALKPAASAANLPVIVMNEADLTVQAVTMGTGVLLKRGLGKLTIDARTGKCATLANNPGDHYNGGGCKTSSAIVFAADGTPPTYGYGGFTVQEGEVVVKGDGSTPVAFSGAIHVGLHSESTRSSPILTLDGVAVSFGGAYQQTEVGIYGHFYNSNALRPTLRLLNGTKFNSISTGGIRLSDGYVGNARYPVVAVTNSTVGGGFSFSTIRNGGGYGAFLAANSTLWGATLDVSGRTKSRLTACTLEGASSGYATFSSDEHVAGEILFDGGTLVKVNGFSMSSYVSGKGGEMVFAFDEATWDVGPASITLNNSNLIQTQPKKFEVRDGGLSLLVAEGTTFRTAAPFVGDGPLTLLGGGTFKFDSAAFGLTGTVTVANGTLDLSYVASVGNLVLKGPGTVTGATFGSNLVLNPGISSDWQVGAAPTFEGCTFTKPVTVACGHGGELVPTRPSGDLVVARYTGRAPDVSKWTATGISGTNIKGTFVAENGEIILHVGLSGFIFILE